MAGEGLHELSDLRRINSTTYDAGGGKHLSVITIHPQHFVAPDGRLLPIDTSIKPAHSEGAAYQNTSNILQSTFAGSGAEVSATAGGATVSYQPVASRFSDGQRTDLVGRARPVSPRASGNVVRYDGALPDMDVVYRVAEGKVLQQFVLSRPPATPAGMVPEATFFEIGETLSITGGTLMSVNGDLVHHGFETQGALLIDSAGQTLRLAAPFASEPIAGSPALTDAVPGSYRVEIAADGSVTLWTRIPQSWLAEPGRQYPVVIDPTLDVMPDAAAGKDAQLTPFSPDNNWGTREFLTDNWGSVDARGILEFDLSSIPGGSSVSAATITLWHHWNTEFTNIGLHANNASWNENTVTWNNAPGHDAAPVDSFSPGASSFQYEDWNVTTDVQDFVDGSRSNFGWTLKSDAANVTAYYISSDGDGINGLGFRPRLVVEYAEGGGGGGGDCDLTPIEAKLDDETRFTDDAELAAAGNVIRGDIALLEAKSDAAALMLAEIRDLSEILRMTIIEHDLAQEKEGSKLMVLTCLPDAQGGNLEQLRALVELRIDAAEAAGCSSDALSHARADLATGDESYAAGAYIRACDTYAKGYHSIGVHCP